MLSLRIVIFVMALTALFAGRDARAQGTIPVALTQQISANGQPLAGALLYLYVAGTVSTPQTAYEDVGLTLPLPWPVAADNNGRIPMFYLASGSVHVRLTDASGTVLFDYPTMLVIGPSGGGGGGGASVDPTSVLSTGDIKFRATSETLTGWVKINGQTVGSALSGASGYANAGAQNLFIYLWTNCTNPHCPVLTGRGATALADFQANKQITLPDWRARIPTGLDDMGNTPAGILQAQNVTSSGDTVTTPMATGGEANHVITLAQLTSHTHTATATTSIIDPGHIHGISDPGHIHGITDPGHVHGPGAGSNFVYQGAPFIFGIGAGGGSYGQINGTASATTGITQANTHTTGITQANSHATGITAGTSVSNTSAGSSNSMNVMQPFILGTWHIKL